LPRGRRSLVDQLCLRTTQIHVHDRSHAPCTRTRTHAHTHTHVCKIVYTHTHTYIYTHTQRVKERDKVQDNHEIVQSVRPCEIATSSERAREIARETRGEKTRRRCLSERGRAWKRERKRDSVGRRAAWASGSVLGTEALLVAKSRRMQRCRCSVINAHLHLCVCTCACACACAWEEERAWVCARAGDEMIYVSEWISIAKWASKEDHTHRSKRSARASPPTTVCFESKYHQPVN
jgi:hypothetical protein